MPESTETTKKSSRPGKSKKRKAEYPLLSKDRYADHRQVGFVSDKEACADLLYGLKHAAAPASIPPLGELEMKNAYVKYAHVELKNKAFLNSIFLDYEKKLKVARQAGDVAELEKLKSELGRSRGVVASASLQLSERQNTIKALQSELEAKQKDLDKTRGQADQYFEDLSTCKGNFERSSAELKAIGKHSNEVMARAGRLRERLVYLEKTKNVSKQLEQVRSNLDLVKTFAEKGIEIPKKVFDRLEKDKARLEAQLGEHAVVELREGDLSPFEPYVPVSDEFEELLATFVPLEHGEDDAMNKATDAGVNEDARDPDAQDGVQDPAAGRSDEEERGGEKNPPAE